MQKHVELADPATPSATFILTSSGHAYPVTSLASSSSASDILLLRLSPTPLNNASPSSPVPALRPLPINPYPPPPESRIALHTYLNPLSRLSRKLARLPAREWARGRVAEYKDAAGRTAEVGTYDELAAMWVDCVPSEGSSGGPVVDCESGSVVGVTRGRSLFLSLSLFPSRSLSITEAALEASAAQALTLPMTPLAHRLDPRARRTPSLRLRHALRAHL